MRRIIIANFAIALLVANTGLPPRPSASDYPARESTPAASFGATIVDPEQVKKYFSPYVSRNWVVVEVGIYPQNGQALDVDFFDFALKLGDEDLARPGTPTEVASVWSDKTPSHPGRGPNVVTETGVVYSSGRDPYNGRQHGWGTYTGVAVDNDPRVSPPPPSPSGPDPAVIERKALDRALPVGQTSRPVAGYLYFPVSSKKAKAASLALTYSKDNAAIRLALPKK